MCVLGLLSPMKRELLLRLQSEIENVTDAWLSTALKSLLHIQSRSEQHTCPVQHIQPRFGYLQHGGRLQPNAQTVVSCCVCDAPPTGGSA